MYENQLELFKNKQLNREPYEHPTFSMDNSKIRTLTDVLTIKDPVSCFKVDNYKHHPAIKYPFTT